MEAWPPLDTLPASGRDLKLTNQAVLLLVTGWQSESPIIGFNTKSPVLLFRA